MACQAAKPRPVVPAKRRGESLNAGRRYGFWFGPRPVRRRNLIRFRPRDAVGGTASGSDQGPSGGETSSGSGQETPVGGKASGSDQGPSGGETTSGNDQGAAGGSGSGSDNSPSGGDGTSGSAQGSGSGSEHSSAGGSTARGNDNTNKKSDVTASGNRATNMPIEIVRDAVGAEYNAHEIVVMASSADASALHSDAYTIVSKETLSGLGVSLLTLRTTQLQNDVSVLSALRTSIPGAASDLDHVYRLATSNDATSTTGSGARLPQKLQGMVGLIDAAIDAQYPTVRAAIVESRTFASGSMTDLSHGTANAELVATHGAKVLDASVFSNDAHGTPAATAVAVIRALDWLVTRGVTVINLSLTGPQNQALSDAIRRAQLVGCIIVAAAGNEGPAAPAAYPAADAGVVAVTAVDRENRSYRYSNHGAYISFSALGVDVDTPEPPNARRMQSGTSFAAPVVAAAIARAVERRTPQDSAKLLQWFESHAIDLGEPGRDPVFGFGLLVPKIKRKISWSEVDLNTKIDEVVPGLNRLCGQNFALPLPTAFQFELQIGRQSIVDAQGRSGGELRARLKRRVVRRNVAITKKQSRTDAEVGHDWVTRVEIQSISAGIVHAGIANGEIS